MTVADVYDKYRHLDRLLSDTEWLGEDNFRSSILHDLWLAVRAEALKQQAAVKAARA